MEHDVDTARCSILLAANHIEVSSVGPNVVVGVERARLIVSRSVVPLQSAGFLDIE